jgi:hypothetical protein
MSGFDLRQAQSPINVAASATLILSAARSRNTLIRSISVRLIAITVIGPMLPN